MPSLDALDILKTPVWLVAPQPEELVFANGAARQLTGEATLERLRQLVDKAVIEPLDGAAYEEAYHFIQQTRMQQHQLQMRENQPYSNRVDPDSLNHLDRRILRESLRQAQRLQSSLALRYQL